MLDHSDNSKKPPLLRRHAYSPIEWVCGHNSIALAKIRPLLVFDFDRYDGMLRIGQHDDTVVSAGQAS